VAVKLTAILFRQASPDDSSNNQRQLNNQEGFVMKRYRPVTGTECIIASLLIDIEAPLDVLHETACRPHSRRHPVS
jgi:hypothetical protein